MQRLLLALSVVILGLPAIAQADSWTGEDKYLHFTISAGLGAAAYTQTHNRSKAFAWAMLPGVLKEIADSQTDGNNFSGKDLAWDALGAFSGVQASHWYFSANRLTYVHHF